MSKKIIISVLSLLLLMSIILNKIQNDEKTVIREQLKHLTSEYSCISSDMQTIMLALINNNVKLDFLTKSIPNHLYLTLEDGKQIKFMLNNLEIEVDNQYRSITNTKIQIDSTYYRPCYRVIIPPQGMDIEFEKMD